VVEPPGPEVVAALRAAGCVFAEDEARLLAEAAAGPAELAGMVARRVAGLPLEQIVGWAEFRGLRVAVEPGVFVPRRRSEFLVERAVAATRPPSVVLDLCCGSGAVGLAVATELETLATGTTTGTTTGSVELHAADVDPAAVRCARRNLPGGHVYQGDLYRPLPAELRGRVDVLVTVTPYVPTGEIRLMPPEARLHEPRAALDGGADGLDVLRRVAEEAPAWLAPRGTLLTETGDRQAPAAERILAAEGLTARVERSADLGATVVRGTLPR
jgi:release factor glutamine methyltransferase